MGVEITNAGFEAGPAGDSAPGWELTDIAGFTPNVALVVTDQAHSGVNGLSMRAQSLPPGPFQGQSRAETLQSFSVIVGREYTFKFWLYLVLATDFFFIPFFGTFFGAVLGTFVGAIVGELTVEQATIKGSMKPAIGATIGRVLGTMSKVGIAMAMWMTLTVSAFVTNW